MFLDDILTPDTFVDADNQTLSEEEMKAYVEMRRPIIAAKVEEVLEKYYNLYREMDDDARKRREKQSDYYHRKGYKRKTRPK